MSHSKRLLSTVILAFTFPLEKRKTKRNESQIETESEAARRAQKRETRRKAAAAAAMSCEKARVSSPLNDATSFFSFSRPFTSVVYYTIAGRCTALYICIPGSTRAFREIRGPEYSVPPGGFLLLFDCPEARYSSIIITIIMGVMDFSATLGCLCSDKGWFIGLGGELWRTGCARDVYNY